MIKLLRNLFVLNTGLNFRLFLMFKVFLLCSKYFWSLFCSLWIVFLNSLSTSSWRRSESFIRPDLADASLYEQKGKMIRIARFCTLQVRWRGIWGDRYERRKWHAYSVIGRVQVQAWNELTHGYQDRERLSWDKLYKRLLAFLMMLSMWQFHLKYLDMLRRSILALAARSIGIPSTTTGSNKVVLLVLKFIRSSLHLVSLSWKSYLRTHGLPGCQQRLGYNSLFSFLSSAKLWYRQHISRDRC